MAETEVLQRNAKGRWAPSELEEASADHIPVLAGEVQTTHVRSAVMNVSWPKTMSRGPCSAPSSGANQDGSAPLRRASAVASSNESPTYWESSRPRKRRSIRARHCSRVKGSRSTLRVWRQTPSGPRVYGPPQLLSRILDTASSPAHPEDMSTAWDEWERLRSGEDPDPIEVLRTVSKFQLYFSAVETEAVRVARAKGHTWEQIGSALGRSRQAIWQRVASPRLLVGSAGTKDPRTLDEAQQEWEAIKRDPNRWLTKTRKLHIRSD